jgi:hypothetical protein
LVQPPVQQAPNQQPQSQPGQLKKRRKKKSANSVGLGPGGLPLQRRLWGRPRQCQWDSRLW